MIRTSRRLIKGSRTHPARRFSSRPFTASSSPRATAILSVGAASATLIGVSLYASSSRPVLAESPGSTAGYEAQSQLHGGKLGTITPAVFIWGRNSHNVASPASPDSDIIKKPRRVAPFDGAVLRDLALSETYGVAVDAAGTVLQWGLGFGDNEKPHPTLKNKDVLKVAVAGPKVFALTRKGEVVVFPAELEKQKVGEERRTAQASWWRLGWFGAQDFGTDAETLKPDVALQRSERFVSISTGKSHLLALTSAGRAFALPLDLSANNDGQLGVRRVTLLSLHPSSLESGAQVTDLIPDLAQNESLFEIPPPPARLDPLLLPPGQSAPPLPPSTMTPPPISTPKPTPLQEERTKDVRFATVLHEIPALRGIAIAELVAGARHSLARTVDGRVLGWGANNYGQLGLGVSLSYPAIPTPTEVPLIKSYPKSTRLACTRIAAGGNVSYFVVDREDVKSGVRDIDLLATGNGQFGGIGNGNWAHAAQPVKVKSISGLREWSEKSQSNEPIAIRDIIVGTTHVAAVLDNAVEQPGGVKFGRDVFVWGHNEWYQLGTGKRSNLSSPQHLPPLPYPGLSAPPSATAEELPSSGTLSPMPHARLQLAPAIKVNGKWAEETIIAGDGGSAVYWRVLNP